MAGEMSDYEKVITGKLRLKGKTLDVRGSDMKKKKKQKKANSKLSHALGHDQVAGEMNDTSTYLTDWQSEREQDQDDRLTPAERRYLEHWQKIELQRLAKTAKKSHRDRVQEFNQYLANMSEHYDIPKVGPG